MGTASFPGSLILPPGASEEMRDPGNEVAMDVVQNEVVSKNSL